VQYLAYLRAFSLEEKSPLLARPSSYAKDGVRGAAMAVNISQNLSCFTEHNRRHGKN
jgi:hypothetical protein